MARSDRNPASLTVRGRSLLAAGGAAILCALILREVNLLRIGVFLVALPLLSYAVVARSRYRLSCGRRVEPVRATAGSPSRVVLRLENVSRFPTGILLAEDSVPYLLGGRPRFVLDRLRPERAVEVDYTVRAPVRGKYRLGPLSVKLTDPFGLCDVARSFIAADTLVATPVVEILPEVRLGGASAGTGESRTRTLATAGEDDAATREYRQGDDLRRIHWRSTARLGELMVRREEQPWQSRAAVLLDCRAFVHRGDGPSSSFEWAVSATASIALHLARGAYEVRVVTDGGDEITAGSAGPEQVERFVLDDLAVRGLSTSGGLNAGLTALRRGGGEEVMVALVAALDPDDAQQLARALHGAATVGVALVLDTPSWSRLDPATAATRAAEFDETCAVLSRAGWRVLPVRMGASLPALWPGAGTGLAANVSRAAARKRLAGTGS
jgi:uncharacterized protein (DUF58 family)